VQLNVPPDLETLINKRLSSGAYTNAEDVLRRALEVQDAEESWTDEERRALLAQQLAATRHTRTMSVYGPTALAKADILHIWCYIANDSEDAANGQLDRNRITRPGHPGPAQLHRFQFRQSVRPDRPVQQPANRLQRQ
jgi:Arc/MetJ-type ribon-helix-helix transcriptional regulator